MTSLKIQDGWETKNNFSYHWVIFASLCSRITENVQCTFLHLCSTCWRMESSILFFVINSSKLRSFAFLSVFSKIPIMKNKAIDRMAASCYSGFIFETFPRKWSWANLSKILTDAVAKKRTWIILSAFSKQTKITLMVIIWVLLNIGILILISVNFCNSLLMKPTLYIEISLVHASNLAVFTLETDYPS